ncbi:MAG TPA: hypothetical protein VD788_08515 [Candidatus Polarisedimenticolaceae bacterium]|nr:hypothetical protein [Candidatus Polarisedimenticolaceae bacterium]
MRRSLRFQHRRGVVFLALLSALSLNCGSEETYAPPVDTCDEQYPGTFSIDSPEVGHVYVWAGTGQPGAGAMGNLPGATRLYWPVEVNFDPAGSPIVLDWNNHRVLALDGEGEFEKIIGRYFGNPNDGPALEADLNHPTHVVFSPDGSKLILSAWHNSILMEMDLVTNWIAKYCGTGGRCFNGDGQARLASCLDLPVCALYHPISGELYFSDQANHIVRRIDASGVVHVVAGSMPIFNGTSWVYQFGFGGDGGPATSALLNFERTQTANPSGKFCFAADGTIYIADTKNNAVRVVHTDGTIDTYAGKPAVGAGYSGDGGPATEAQLSDPRDVAIDTDGTLFIADTGNHVIRQVAPDGTISTAVGIARPRTADAISACALHDENGGLASEVHLTAPHGIELDADGNLWISDTLNQVIRIYYR